MNLKKATKEILNPRFTTEDMERGFTRCGLKNELNKFIYDDEHPKLPVRVTGSVTTKLGSRYDVVWNQYGECFFHGNRMRDFDLIHPEQSKIDSANLAMVSLIGLALFLISYRIWN